MIRHESYVLLQCVLPSHHLLTTNAHKTAQGHQKPCKTPKTHIVVKKPHVGHVRGAFSFVAPRWAWFQGGEDRHEDLY